MICRILSRSCSWINEEARSSWLRASLRTERGMYMKSVRYGAGTLRVPVCADLVGRREMSPRTHEYNCATVFVVIE